MRLWMGAVAAAALLAPSAQAQMRLAEKGVTFGLNWAELENGGSTGDRFGFAAGGFWTFEVSDVFSFQPQALFTMKGGEGSGYEFAVDYIECQGLARWSFMGSRGASPVALAGLSAGFRIIDDQTVGGTSTDPDTNLFELGAVFGGGAQFPAGNGKMQVDLRFSVGLTDVPDEGSEKNHVTSLMVGYAF